MSAYIWAASQTEPGLNDVDCRITKNKIAPGALKPTTHFSDETLIEGESLYSDWELLGTIDGEAYYTECGETCVVMQTPVSAGQTFSAHDIVVSGFYKKE